VSAGATETVTLVPTPGHTPGHQSVVAEAADRRVLVTGDALVHAVQLANPEVAYRFEVDPVAAVETRRRLLSGHGTGTTLVASAHLRRAFVEL
jgi:glyoxylase-like metal-dependent hydrolase (beta-lactamase superfamily II)